MQRLQGMARRKGGSGKSERWMSSFDASTAVAAGRHLRMLLVDIALVVQHCSPFGLAAGIGFDDDLNTVFQKTGQSMKAAAHILRDERMIRVRDHASQALVVRGTQCPLTGVVWELGGFDKGGARRAGR